MSDQKPKVLLVGWGYPPNIDGGLDIHVYHLFQELKKRSDIEVSLALPEERAPEKEDIHAIESGDGDMIWKSRKISSEIANIAEDYDIVHTHDWFGAEAGFKAKKYSDVKWISTSHSLFRNRTRGTSKEIEELEKVGIVEPDELITVSNKLKNEIKEKFDLNSYVVHNGFSEPKVSGENIKEKLEIQGKMIFFVGRHAEQKGIEHLLYGFKKLLDSLSEVKLVIGGDGYMTKPLKNFAELLGIEENVIFTGFIPDRKLGDYYKAADVFVSPSINEPFGLTITEALESGTTVVATSNGAEEVISGRNMISIEPNSDSIREGLLKGLKAEFEDEVESRTWKKVAEETLKVYKEVN